MNEAGLDDGLRFVDVNEDGYDDVLVSNQQRFALHLYVPKLFLGFHVGWAREVTSGQRGDPGALPQIVRAAPHRNDGAWFRSRTLWVQDEDTAHLPDLVERRSFATLLAGRQPPPLEPAAAH